MSEVPVVITQSGDRGRSLTERLLDKGIVAVHHPLIDTVPIEAKDFTTQLNELPRHFTAWIFTSVTAARVWLDLISFHSKWSQGGPVCYCIGDATAMVLRAAGYDVVVFDGVRDAESLVHAIAQKHARQQLDFVFVRGQMASSAVPVGLHLANHRVYDLVVYETKRQLISAQVLSVYESGRSIWVLFSPSGVESLLYTNSDFVRHAVEGEVFVVAFGRTTARAVQEAGIPIAAVPETVTHDALIHTIETLLQRIGYQGGKEHEF